MEFTLRTIFYCSFFIIFQKMRVFVFGATGFIGNGIATLFASEGWQVYGLARSEEKATSLRKQEIIPVIGKAQEPESYKAALESADVIIEALADYQDHTTVLQIQKVLKPFAKSKLVIYTSGVWVYGNTSHFVDENSDLTPADLVKGRPAIEKEYLEAGAVVVRPGCLYGQSGSLTKNVFAALKEGKGVFPGFSDRPPSWATVHISDLARGYLLVAKKGALVRGQSFNFVSQSEDVREIAKEASKFAGFKGEIQLVEPKDPFSVCMALSQKHISSAKAKIVLGWEPLQPSLVLGIEKYYHAAINS